MGFWQHEVDKVLIQGIFARNVTQDEVVQRVRSVWPKLSISWLGARMEEVARTGLPRWMDQAFWATEIDPILLSGLRNASQCLSEAVETVLHAFPQLHLGMIWVSSPTIAKTTDSGLASSSDGICGGERLQLLGRGRRDKPIPATAQWT